jgi:hypothetical protein
MEPSRLEKCFLPPANQQWPTAETMFRRKEQRDHSRKGRGRGGKKKIVDKDLNPEPGGSRFKS